MPGRGASGKPHLLTIPFVTLSQGDSSRVFDAWKTNFRAMTGQRLRWIEVATLATGAPLRVPVHEVDGGAAGPCLGVSALLHGDEVTGPEVVRRVLDGVDPENLRGRLRLVPVANPLAFQTLTRVTP